MKLSELLRDVDVLELHAPEGLEIADVAYDSRRAAPGGVFVAVRGFDTDGHKYIGSAVGNGAACVICEEAPECATPYVVVRDSRLALAIASRNFFRDPSSEMTVIGVTGTNGKTTTTYLTKHMLEVCLDAKVGLVGTNGNMIGGEFIKTEHTTPESCDLQRLFREMADAGCTHVVMEVSSHSLALNRVAGVSFGPCVFTNLTQDHLDFHKDMADYAAAKAKLFTMCGLGIVNADDEWSGFMAERAGCPMHSFSCKDAGAELYAKDIALTASGVSFTAVHGAESVPVKLGIPGHFSVYNALGVLGIGLALGIGLEDAAGALASARGVKGRVEVVPTDGDYTILIDYAHTPDALENVLRSMREVTDGRLVALFGCGGDRDRKKRPIMGAIAAECADFVVVTSDNPRTEEPEAIIADILEGMAGSATPKAVICSRPEAIEWAIEHHLPGDVIVLAGKGHEDYQIVGHVKHHMDEREIVADVLRKRKMYK